MSRLLSKRPCIWELGTVHHAPASFLLHEEQLSRHMAVFGGSGSGKSKFLELLCRRMIDDYRRFCFIDPHGDTVEDLLSYAAKRAETLRTDAVFKRIHYLEPTYQMVFGFDPFEFRLANSIPEEEREQAYYAWLHTKVDAVAEIVQRKQGQSDFQGMARLQRILRDVLFAAGVRLLPGGQHLPLSDMLVLLDRHHPRYSEVMGIVMRQVPPDVRGDFVSIQNYRSEEQLKREIESTINRLRSLLSPIIKAILDCRRESIDFRKIIASGGIVLVNLRKTDFFSADQRNAIGGLLIHEVLSAVENTPREDRMPYYLIVDEARLFIGEDLMEALDQARKFKLSICLAGQHLGQFRSKEFDMTPSILNNCGTIISFQQKHPEDLEIWKQYFGYSNLNFEKHFQVMDRPAGYELIGVEDWSESYTKGRSIQHGTSETRSRGSSLSFGSSESETTGKNVDLGKSVTRSFGRSHVDNFSTADQHGVNWSESQQQSSGGSDSRSTGEVAAQNSSIQQSPILEDRHVVGYREATTQGRNLSQSSQNSHSASWQQSQGSSAGGSSATTETHGTADGQTSSIANSESQSEGKSSSYGTTHSRTSGHTRSETHGTSTSFGTSESEGITKNHKKVPMQQTREEWQETPNLLNSVQNQLDRFAALQRSLPPRHALASISGQKESIVVRIADVNAPYTPRELVERIKAVKKKLYALHPYYSTPTLSPEEQEKRLEEFLLQFAGPKESSPDSDFVT